MKFAKILNLNEKSTKLYEESEEDIILTSQQKKEISQKISTFNKYGQILHDENDLNQISTELSELAQNAKKLALGLTNQDFDKITVQRNMKDLERCSDELRKTAVEVQLLKKRMVALYDEMGTILNRYFEIK